LVLGEAVPLYGTAYTRADETVTFGVTAVALSLGANVATYSFYASDLTLAGTGEVDSDDDGVADAGTVTWTAVDCETLTFP